jgi:hypothetical protein
MNSYQDHILRLYFSACTSISDLHGLCGDLNERKNLMSCLEQLRCVGNSLIKSFGDGK